MTRPLRRFHLRVMVVWAALLPLFLAVAILSRRPIPVLPADHELPGLDMPRPDAP